MLGLASETTTLVLERSEAALSLTPVFTPHVHVYTKLLGIIILDFDLTDQLVIRYCFRYILQKEGMYNGSVHQLFVDFKKAYESGRKKVLHNILIDFGIPMKSVRLIKVCKANTVLR
jgi:hypothetical protein